MPSGSPFRTHNSQTRRGRAREVDDREGRVWAKFGYKYNCYDISKNSCFCCCFCLKLDCCNTRKQEKYTKRQ